MVQLDRAWRNENKKAEREREREPGREKVKPEDQSRRYLIHSIPERTKKTDGRKLSKKQRRTNFPQAGHRSLQMARTPSGGGTANEKTHPKGNQEDPHTLQRRKAVHTLTPRTENHQRPCPRDCSMRSSMPSWAPGL